MTMCRFVATSISNIFASIFLRANHSGNINHAITSNRMKSWYTDTMNSHMFDSSKNTNRFVVCVCVYFLFVSFGLRLPINFIFRFISDVVFFLALSIDIDIYIFIIFYRFGPRWRALAEFWFSAVCCSKPSIVKLDSNKQSTKRKQKKVKQRNLSFHQSNRKRNICNKKQAQNSSTHCVKCGWTECQCRTIWMWTYVTAFIFYVMLCIYLVIVHLF